MFLNPAAFFVHSAVFQHARFNYMYRESEMKAYVTKKNIRIFAPSGQKQRSKSIVRTGKNPENNQAFEGTAAFFLKEFNGEVVSAVNPGLDLYPIRNIV